MLPNVIWRFILMSKSRKTPNVRQAEAVGNPLLKKTRYIFLKNDSNLTEKQR